MSKSTSSSSKPILTVAEKQALRDWLVLHEFRANPFDVRVAEHEAKREPYLHTRLDGQAGVGAFEAPGPDR